MSARLEYFNKTARIKVVSVTKALAAAANYDAADVLSESATVGTHWDFDSVVGKNGASGTIKHATAVFETTALTPAITLYLFNEPPTCVLNDNVANTAILHADADTYVGRIDFPAMEDLGTGDSQAELDLNLEFKAAAADNALYGVAVPRAAITGENATDDLIIEITVKRD